MSFVFIIVCYGNGIVVLTYFRIVWVEGGGKEKVHYVKISM